MSDGNIIKVKAFFSTPEKPVQMTEFKEFWESLTEEEKIEIKKQIEELKK